MVGRVSDVVGFVYFIGAPAVRRIKIGWSQDHPSRRLHTFQTGSPVPLVLLAYVEANPAAEKELHRRFASLRVAGEWFEDSPELMEAIEDPDLFSLMDIVCETEVVKVDL